MEQILFPENKIIRKDQSLILGLTFLGAKFGQQGHQINMCTGPYSQYSGSDSLGRY